MLKEQAKSRYVGLDAVRFLIILENAEHGNGTKEQQLHFTIE